jgi:hypothetical protein
VAFPALLPRLSGASPTAAPARSLVLDQHLAAVVHCGVAVSEIESVSSSKAPVVEVMET